MITKHLKQITTKDFLRDAAFLLGLGAIVYGIWMLNHPAAIIFGGAAVSALAYLGASPQEPDGPAE